MSCGVSRRHFALWQTRKKINKNDFNGFDRLIKTLLSFLAVQKIALRAAAIS